ncbi:MAG: DUF58 domain-containing protein [Chloroflexi bacterium]|nr:DUF58 domain-containing protein [Chloroflexota bacterium]
MQLTPRALALLLAGALPLSITALWSPALFVASAYFAVALGLIFADLIISPGRRHFEVTRVCDSKLSLAADNAVELHLYNGSPYAVRLALRDEFPVGFRTDHWHVDGVAAPRSVLLLTYSVKPLRRGDYRFGDINLRYRCRLGLVVRQERYSAAVAVKVYPNLLELRRYELLARRGQLTEIGLRHARMLGRGTEFERLRDYQPDDDYRRINWKATARRGRPMSVEYETERSQNVILMLDAGRLMASPIGPLAKLDHAVNTALMLAYVAVRQGDNVGLLAFADRIGVHLPPRRGKRQFLAMLEALYRLPPHLTEPDYNLAFRYLATHARKRSLVVLFTDLIDAETSRLLVSHIAALSPHHLVICVTIADPGITRLAANHPDNSRSTYATSRRRAYSRRAAAGPGGTAATRHNRARPSRRPPHRFSRQPVSGAESAHPALRVRAACGAPVQNGLLRPELISSSKRNPERAGG